jgi:hypothetical protein
MRSNEDQLIINNQLLTINKKRQDKYRDVLSLSNFPSDDDSQFAEANYAVTFSNLQQILRENSIF